MTDTNTITLSPKDSVAMIATTIDALRSIGYCPRVVTIDLINGYRAGLSNLAIELANLVLDSEKASGGKKDFSPFLYGEKSL